MSKVVDDLRTDLKTTLALAVSRQAYAALVALPGIGWFFALPVISNVTQFITDSIAIWLINETALSLSLLWIEIEMQYDIKDAEDARKKLSEMLHNPEAYSEKQQSEISEYFDESTVNLIQLGISRL